MREFVKQVTKLGAEMKSLKFSIDGLRKNVTSLEERLRELENSYSYGKGALKMVAIVASVCASIASIAVAIVLHFIK